MGGREPDLSQMGSGYRDGWREQREEMRKRG